MWDISRSVTDVHQRQHGNAAQETWVLVSGSPLNRVVQSYSPPVQNSLVFSVVSGPDNG